MRPTLIQQRPVFGQEPAPGVQPAREFSRGESLGIWFGVFIVGMICANQILQCGLARGLGHFAFPVLVCLMPCVFVLLFCFLVCGPTAGGSKWYLGKQVPWVEMVGVSGLMLGLFYLRHFSYIFGIVFVLSMYNPKTKVRRWSRPTRVPWVGLTGIAALLVGIYFLPQFVTRNRLPWLIPGPAAAGWNCLHAMPTITGTWEGRIDGDPALLVVTSQHWQKFDGEILMRDTGYTYKIAVQGTLNRSGAVNMRETQVLDEAFYHDWALGTYAGRHDLSALEMQGAGVDTRGARCYWVLEHVSSAVYIPEN